MHYTTGLNPLFLTECFLRNYREQLKIATTEKAIKFLRDQINALQIQLQSHLN